MLRLKDNMSFKLLFEKHRNQGRSSFFRFPEWIYARTRTVYPQSVKMHVFLQVNKIFFKYRFHVPLFFMSTALVLATITLVRIQAFLSHEGGAKFDSLQLDHKQLLNMWCQYACKDKILNDVYRCDDDTYPDISVEWLIFWEMTPWGRNTLIEILTSLPVVIIARQQILRIKMVSIGGNEVIRHVYIA